MYIYMYAYIDTYMLRCDFCENMLAWEDTVHVVLQLNTWVHGYILACQGKRVAFVYVKLKFATNMQTPQDKCYGRRTRTLFHPHSLT